jgi:two-component system, OmpR family, sensor kinase
MRLRLPGRPRRALLRTRVLAGVLLVTLVTLAAFDVAGVTALRSYLIGQTDGQLRQVVSLYRMVTQVSLAGPGPGAGFGARRGPRQANARPGVTPVRAPRLPPTVFIQAPSFFQPYKAITVSGRRVAGASPSISVRGIAIENAALLPARLPVNLISLADSGQAWTADSANGTPLRLLAAPNPPPGSRDVTVVMTSLDGVDKTVGQLELILVIGSVAAGLLAAGCVAWIMRRGLRPIETMAGQADAITAGDLTSRVSPHDPRTEVGRLGVALNGMLSRIEDFIAEREASQEATRRFFADASHELRTPLASLRANAELYQQGVLAERPQVDEAMRRITLEAKRMSGLVDDMLRLARLDQHPAQKQEPVDLTDLVRGCAERAQVLDPARDWRTCIAPGLEVTGDEELLRRAVDNVLANVSAHTPAGTAATITAAARDGNVIVEVSDEGPGAPAGQLPRIFDRFYRAAAPADRPGAGLGLAIVATVAAAHHGSAEATPNEPSGLRVTLTLPAASAPESADIAGGLTLTQITQAPENKRRGWSRGRVSGVFRFPSWP